MNKVITRVSAIALAAIIALFAGVTSVDAAEHKCAPTNDYHFCVSHVVDKATVKPGDVVTYTAKVVNDGDKALNTVKLAFHLSPYVTYVKNSMKAVYSDGFTWNESQSDDPMTKGLNLGNLKVGEFATITYQAKIKDSVKNNDFVETTVQVNSLSTGLEQNENWVQCATHSIVKITPIPTPTPTPTATPTPTPTPESTPTPTPTPTPTGEVLSATPTPTMPPVDQLPSTGPGIALVASLGGIVSALMGRKYFLSR